MAASPREDAARRWGELRAMLHHAPDELSWQHIARLLTQWPDTHQLRAEVIPYAQNLLALPAWQPIKRLAPHSWLDSPSTHHDLLALANAAHVHEISWRTLQHLPFARHLRHLRLDLAAGLSPDSLHPFALSAPALETLELAGGAWSQIFTLCTEVQRARLTTLALWGSHISAENMAQMALLNLPALQELSLSSSTLTADALDVLQEAPWFERLDALDLSYTVREDDAAWVRLAHNGLQRTKLRALSLDGCVQRDDEAMAQVLQAVDATRLDELSLCSSALGPRSLRALGALLCTAPITQLYLADCSLEDDALFALTGALPQGAPLSRLNLEGNNLAGHGIKALLGRLAPGGLVTLSLGGNPLEQGALSRCAQALAAQPLRFLSLSQSAPGEALGELLASCGDTLGALDLNRATLDEAAVLGLTHSVLPQLEELYMDELDARSAAVDGLSAASWLVQLTELSARKAPLGAVARAQLDAALSPELCARGHWWE